MGTPQNSRWGLRGSRSTRLEPQNAWDSFLFAAGVPEASKGDSYLHVENIVSPHVEAEVEEVTSEGHKLEATLPQQQIPWRRGRPRKNKEVGGESQVPIESCARSAAEEFLMHAIWLEPVETTSRGSGSQTRREEASGSNVRGPNPQLEQAQLTIAELYQENRELRWQLVAKNLEVSAPQGHEGNTTWLKRQLREAQDTIVQLREVQRVSEEQTMKTPQGARSSRGEISHAEEA
jgi:hypothetical protein